MGGGMCLRMVSRGSRPHLCSETGLGLVLVLQGLLQCHTYADVMDSVIVSLERDSVLSRHSSHSHEAFSKIKGASTSLAKHRWKQAFTRVKAIRRFKSVSKRASIPHAMSE